MSDETNTGSYLGLLVALDTIEAIECGERLSAGDLPLVDLNDTQRVDDLLALYGGLLRAVVVREPMTMEELVTLARARLEGRSLDTTVFDA